MKRDFLPFFSRAIGIFFIFALILFLSFIAAAQIMKSAWAQKIFSATPAQTVLTGPELAQLQFSDGQQMSSDNFNLSVAADSDLPAAMLLPIKTLTDFASTSATLAIIKTNRGDLEVQLFPSAAPLTVTNFAALAEAGFYNRLRFHRVEPGFVVQVGDPASRDATTPAQLSQLGTGYPGYRILDEISPALSHNQKGILSMANINLTGAYPHSGGSQFFITLNPATYLDGRYSIFGQVVSGLEVLDQLTLGDQIIKISLK